MKTIEQYYKGLPVIVKNKYYRVQIKTSKNKILNLIYRYRYGYKRIYFIGDGTIIKTEYGFMMNPNTLMKLKDNNEIKIMTIDKYF